MNTARVYDHVLHASHILCRDAAGGTRMLENGTLAVAGGRISAIGLRPAVCAGAEIYAETDLGRALILPGLVNAHTHVSMTLFRGLADDLPFIWSGWKSISSLWSGSSTTGWST